MALAREAGAGGATILHGRSAGRHGVRVFNIEIQKEKEIIFWLTDARISRAIASRLHEQLELGGEGGGAVFTMPSGAQGLDIPVAVGARPGTAETAAHPGEISTAEEMMPEMGEEEEEINLSNIQKVALKTLLDYGENMQKN